MSAILSAANLIIDPESDEKISGNNWITVEGTGKPFIRLSFDTPEFCYECALELEDTFDVLQVLSLRPGETIERIEEMIRVWLDRERVARIWG